MNLAHNYISDLGLCELAVALAHNTSLISLSVSSNPASTSGACALLCSLPLNKSLRRLVLSDLRLGPPVAEQLVASLRACKTVALESLELQRNALGDAGGALIADYIKDPLVDAQLISLNLSFNGMTDKSGLLFARAFARGGSRLTTVDLYGNHFTDRVAFAVTAAVPLTSKLSFLSLGGAAFSADGTAALRAFQEYHIARLKAAAEIDPTVPEGATILIHVHDGVLGLSGRTPRCPVGHLLLATFSPRSILDGIIIESVNCAACRCVRTPPEESVYWCAICAWGLCYDCAYSAGKRQQAEALARETFWERYKYATLEASAASAAKAAAGGGEKD